MAYKRLVNTANDPSMGPIFRFTTYESANAPFHNNSSRIDFVTKEGDLYVCVEDGVGYKPGSPSDNGFLMLVQRGKDGRPGAPGAPGQPGPAPEYTLKFDGKQLIIIDQNGVRKAASPELTGPAWFPELQGHTITWKRKEADDATTPQNINLDELRPIETRPVLFRCNSDNTKRSDEESGPGYYIQWKREGNEEWTNLMSISELMNIALAGVCFWWADDENGATDTQGNPIQRLHFGHKQVVKATYDSSKVGNRKIADVELGDVLFDAGEIPFANYDDAIAALTAYLNDLEEDLGAVRASVPTRVSQLENDVPYVKSINNNHPNSNGEIKVKTIDSIDIVGESGNVPFATINGRKIANTDENFVIPSNYLVPSNIKTLSGQSLIKGSDVDVDLPLKTVNNQSIIGVGNIDVSGGSGSGVDNIAFRVQNNVLQYRISTNGAWGNWTDINLPSGSGQNEHVELKIENNVLKIKYNSGSWQDVGSVAGGSGSGDTVNGIVNVSKSGNNLIFTKQDGTTITITLPEGGSCDLSNYYTKTESDSRYVIRGGDDPSDPVPAVITYRTFTIYKWYDADSDPATPTLPTSASWDVANSQLVLTGNTLSWQDHPGNRPDDSKQLWIAMITLMSDGTSSNAFDGPINLTAYPGKDGNGIEFIYTLCADINEYNALSTPVAPHDDNRDDDYPAHWTDHPQGMGEYDAQDEIATHHTFVGDETVLFKLEAASIRTSSNGVWSAYCEPFIWAMWGEDGIDGDGIEYVFRLADDDDVDINNGVITLKQSITRPDNSWAYDSPTGLWTDEPSGVNDEDLYEFVSVRKYHVDPQTKVGSWGNWSEPSLWAKFGKDGDPADAVSIQGQVRYYKAAAEATGITAPATNLDPTLPANGGWLTSANTIQLTEQLPYLWFFERITYSNGNVWQSVPVIVRYRNAAAEVNYQEIISNVETAIQEDLDALDSRLDDIEDSYAITTIDSENALISAVTGYVDGNNKSFADIIVDGKEATIKNWAGSAVADGLGRQSLTAVKNELDGIDGRITTAATNARNGAVSDARTEWSAADATITSTVDKATYVWVNNTDGSIVAYNGESDKTGYTKKLVSQAMSTIQVQSDKIWAAVGDGNNVAAAISILADAQTSGGKIQLDANNIILNGDVVAGAISTAQLDASQIVSGTINSDRINTNTLTVKNINCDTINGASTTIKIVFGDANSLQNPESNTLYFLW